MATLRTIGEVAEHLDLPQHVLRFWETRFKEIDPVKRAGGRRFYRPRDIELVEAIRHLLYREGYTIKGVQRILKEQGVEGVIADVRRRQSGESTPAPAPPEPVQNTPPEPASRVESTAGPFTPPPSRFAEQASLDLPEPEPQTFASEAPDVEAAPIFEPSSEIPGVAPDSSEPIPVAPPVFNAPVVVTRRLDQEQAQLLRGALAEIEECKRLLNLTRR
ncbi:MerR family transcriptional regulator [Methylocystis parvus]|uniref:MerR family transcriptional regulator n=1 Tax=Methylocystis parvus TaxID=134 RepID=A0A6B8MDW1_9HYPH|nr:MerR family transcriptional regulator [Methylocystis parvus]